ncbi:hypothetical protein MESS2_p140019 [Mesorhizobium metallidurans STM 2683]|uniref:Uncharacterized protein n=1 Tax=Mesorhizobium metallidurans STM 2683 TaxID=1297569 RepID=M5EZX3_9HYPH|nr:hypothetical protein MESS2_p140019 [Mesorhizobium metallidurans STM 2683]
MEAEVRSRTRYQRKKRRCRPTAPHLHLAQFLPALLTVPVVDILTDAILLDTVAFLDFAFELVALASDPIEIVISEFTPPFLDLAFDLLPISFDAVPIHGP